MPSNGKYRVVANKCFDEFGDLSSVYYTIDEHVRWPWRRWRKVKHYKPDHSSGDGIMMATIFTDQEKALETMHKLEAGEPINEAVVEPV